MAELHKRPEIRSVGRPRSLTLEILLDTANQMGLAEISMKRLSARLGVGIATLYRYVSNRDELVRLASARNAHRKAPEDTRQPWPELVFGYASSLHSSLVGNAHLIMMHLEGGLGTELEIEFLDSFLSAMVARGFTSADAVALFHNMGWIVMGAAVAEAHLTAMRAKGENLDRSLRQALATRELDEVPAIRVASTEYSDEKSRCLWQVGVSHLVRSIALERGEPVPSMKELASFAAIDQVLSAA